MAIQRDQRILPMIASHWDRIYREPMFLLGGAMDAVSLWTLSRRWRVLFVTLPFVVVLLVLLAAAALVRLQSGDSLERRYTAEADRVIPLKQLVQDATQQLAVGRVTEQSAVDADPIEKTANADGHVDLVEKEADAATEAPWQTTLSSKDLARVEMLMDRVIRKRRDNAPAVFRHALAIALQDRLDEAEMEISLFAPVVESGFSPAHAWMAMRLLRRYTDGESIDTRTLYHHLEAASEWDEIDVRLLAAFSDMLLRSNRGEDAMRFMLKAAKRDPAMNLKLMLLAKTLDLDKELRQAADHTESHYRKSLGAATETERDRIAVAESRSLVGEIDEAIQILKDGLVDVKDPVSEKPQLSTALSEAYRIKYFKTVNQQPDGKWVADLSILELAADADPLNPGVGESVAAILLMDITAPEKLVRVLRNQMERGIANPETHAIVGQQLLAAGNWEKSAEQWEAVVKKVPRSVSALNNWAMCLIRMHPPKAELAKQKIVEALGYKGSDAELYDSYGEISLVNGEVSVGITMLERSLLIDPNRVNTRKKLIKAYRDAGIIDMMRSHENALDKLLLKLEQDKVNGSSASSKTETASPKP